MRCNGNLVRKACPFVVEVVDLGVCTVEHCTCFIAFVGESTVFAGEAVHLYDIGAKDATYCFQFFLQASYFCSIVIFNPSQFLKEFLLLSWLRHYMASHSEHCTYVQLAILQPM